MRPLLLRTLFSPALGIDAQAHGLVIVGCGCWQFVWRTGGAACSGVQVYSSTSSDRARGVGWCSDTLGWDLARL